MIIEKFKKSIYEHVATGIPWPKVSLTYVRDKHCGIRFA